MNVRGAQAQGIEVHWVYNKGSDSFIPSTNACTCVRIHVLACIDDETIMVIILLFLLN